MANKRFNARNFYNGLCANGSQFRSGCYLRTLKCYDKGCIKGNIVG